MSALTFQPACIKARATLGERIQDCLYEAYLKAAALGGAEVFFEFNGYTITVKVETLP